LRINFDNLNLSCRGYADVESCGRQRAKVLWEVALTR
jgi:hypothetical protein